MELTIENWDLMPKYMKLDNIRMYGDLLYKRVPSSRIPFVEYLCSIPQIEGVLLPEHLLTSEGICYGYTIKRINNSCNISQYIRGARPFDDLDVTLVIPKIFDTLDRIHERFIFGDVRNTNILLTKDDTFFIDAENGIKLDNKNALAPTYYDISINDKVVYTSVLTDNLKALLTSLSLYYNFDFEALYRARGTKELLYTLFRIDAEPSFINYLEHILRSFKNGEINDINSFSIYNKHMDKPTKEDTDKLIRTLKKGNW